jgi:hypothetical protein
VRVDGLEFRRRYVLVLPGVGEPDEAAKVVIERLRAEAAQRAPVA